MAFVLPMPFDLEESVINTATDEKPRGALTLRGGLTFARFDGGLSEGVAGYLRCDGRLLDCASDGVGDGVFGLNVLGTYFDGSVLRHRRVDRSGSSGFGCNGGCVLARVAGAWAMIAPYLAVVRRASWFGRIVGVVRVVAFDDTDAVPRDSAAHRGYEDFDSLSLVG